jgi:DNA-binding transcriptional ArsR family regulator
MVNHRLDALTPTFHALADPTRRAILSRLAQGDAAVGELARPFAMSAPAISKHLKVLERAGLIRREVEGRVHRCHLEEEPLRQTQSWIEEHRRIWEQQFDRLARFLDRTANLDDTNEPEDKS